MLARSVQRDPEPPAEQESKKVEAQGRVLVIEDKADEQEICRYLLEREGFEVLTAATCKEGLRLARQAQPELVVVGLTLPDGEGKEVALEIKLLPALARVPVVGIGAMALESGRDKAFAAYVKTPVAREKFRATVRELLGRRIGREVDARRDRPLEVKS